MVIDRATPDDASAIANLQIAAWRAAHLGLLPTSVLAGFDVSARADRWRDRLAAPATIVFVAQRGTRAVGFVHATLEIAGQVFQRAGEVSTVCVQPESWGRSIGRNLLRRAVQELTEQQCAAITCWVLECSDAARAFVVDGGFALEGMRRLYGITERCEIRYRRSGAARR